jgi:signal peptidase I
MGTDATDTRRWSLTAAGFGADVYLFTVLSLAVWVLLPTVLLGWSPILVSSGSMSPAIKAGDLVLIDEDVPNEPIAPGGIITYQEPGRDPDRLVTHRVRDATDTGDYTTRGDANVVDDARPVPHDRVVGYARLLVPMIGLPIHWARTEAQPALLAFSGLTVLALALSAAATRQDRRVPLHLDTPQPEQTEGGALLAMLATDTAIPSGQTRVVQEQPSLLSEHPGPPVERSRVTGAAAADRLFPVAPVDERPGQRHEPSGRHRGTGSQEPSLWVHARPVQPVAPTPRTRPRATTENGRTAQGRRQQRARAARRRSLQPVLFLVVSAALIASGVSLPVTEAALTAVVPNVGNAFSTAAADSGGAPLPPELVLPPVDGQPSFPSGQQPETITFDFPVAGQTTLIGAAEAVLRVRPSTPGNPPRSVEVTLRHGGGEVLASASLEQQGWNRGWTNVTLRLEPDLDVTLQSGDTLTVEIVIRRLEIDLDGGSIVRLPVAVD